MPTSVDILDLSPLGFNIGMPPALTWTLDRSGPTRAEFRAADGDTTWIFRATYAETGDSLFISALDLASATPGASVQREATFNYRGIGWEYVKAELDDLPFAFSDALTSDFNTRLAPADVQTRFDGSDNRDRLAGGGDNDILLGGRGADRIAGGDGEDVVSGGAADDRVKGGAGHDLVLTGEGRNLASGGSGNDILALSGHLDRASGGAGSDVFLIDRSEARGLDAVLRDFDPAADLLIFAGSEVTLGGDTAPSGVTTLADLSGDLLGGLGVRDTDRGLILTDGDTRVRLDGLSAADIPLGSLFFNEAAMEELVLVVGGSEPLSWATSHFGEVRAGGGTVTVTLPDTSARSFDTLDSADLIWWGDPLDYL